MDGHVTTSELHELIKEGSDLRTTVRDFGDAIIKRVTMRDLSILSVSGKYDRSLGKEIERLCLQCRTNLGLEFTDIEVNPALRKKFDSSIVGVLRTVRNAFQTRRKTLLLCTPPSELVDLLQLTGVYDGYRVVEKPSSAIVVGDLAPTHQSSKRRLRPQHDAKVVQRKIVHLNQSLKRTASLEKGLDSAEKCVKRLLPQTPPSVEGYSFAYSYKTSEKVGGDFFDFIPLDNDRLGILIGDVSGHGLDAALMMGISKKVIQLRAQSSEFKTPYQVFRQSNADLLGDFSRNAFVTALYGVLELSTGAFTFVRAGHEVPVIVDADGKQTVLSPKGMPLGIDSGKNFDRILEETSVQLPKGGFLFLYTDGLAECWNPRGACYTRDRLLFSLSQIKTSRGCQEVLDRILRAISEFAADRAQEDDMTAILLKRMR
jgi:serine phosphatase RsbU (regulator of sigma subunit)